MKLRDYQTRAVANIGRCLSDNGSTLLVMPTGTGKTVVIAHAIKQHAGGKRALVLAHREELIFQNAKTIGTVLGEPVDIERASQWADLNAFHRSRVVVASKDSLHPKRLSRFDASEFGLIVTDEAHHSTADSYGRIYSYFDGVPHLGVTATPDRTDGEALGQVYSSVAMDYEIADAIKDGWLVPVRAHTVNVTDLQLGGIKTTGGDLNQGELAEQLERDRVMHEIAASITRECGNRRAIIFTVSVRQAERMAEILNDYQPDSTRWVCGETPTEQRHADLSAHRRGECQFMVNVGVLTEGYDDPGCSMIVMARPTKSRSLFAQCLGRGTRPLPGTVDGFDDARVRVANIAASGKPNLMVLDFTGNCGKHKLVTPADVLGGKYSQEDRDTASAMLLDSDDDVCETLDRAREQREEGGSKEERREYDASKFRIVAQAKYLLSEEDLFDGAFRPGRERTWLVGKAPTDKQVDTLERHGFKREDVMRMNKNECSRLIGEIVLRVHAGKCTIKQAAALERRGIKNARDLSFQEASAHLDRIYGAHR